MRVQVGGQLLQLLFVVVEGKLLRLGLEEKVKRVVHRHLHHEIDGDLEFGGFLGEHQPRLVVAKRVLLPVHKMLGRLDRERVRDNGATAMRRGPQAHDLGAEVDRAVVFVVRDVV